MEILALQHAIVSDDGRHISLMAETDAGQAAIEINAATLNSMLQELTALSTRLKDTGIVQALRPTRGFARPTDDRKAVLLGLGLANMIPLLFALDPMAADHLQGEIAAAVKACRTG